MNNCPKNHPCVKPALRQRRHSCRAHRHDPLAATTKNDDLGCFVTIDPIADTHSCARLAGSKSGCPVFLSDPRRQKIRIRKNGAGGKAATVAGYAGPGFHNWPSGHIPQNTAPNPLLRSRPHAKKAFGEAFGAATGVSDPSYRGTGAHAPLPSGHRYQTTT